MPLFVVTYTHPNEEGWREHLVPHIGWLQDQLKAGTLKASGPFNGVPTRSAMLIMAAESREALLSLIATDPFAEHGLIEDMTITEWDPIFGAFNADSTMAGRSPGSPSLPSA